MYLRIFQIFCMSLSLAFIFCGDDTLMASSRPHEIGTHTAHCERRREPPRSIISKIASADFVYIVEQALYCVPV